MNPYHEHHIVRLRRRVISTRHLHKRIYKYHRYELTIPAKYKDLVEEFMNKDLKVEARKEGSTLILEAKPVVGLY